jgi:hypothetical protein
MVQSPREESFTTMDYRHICTAAMIAHYGLRTAHNAASELTCADDSLDAKANVLGMRQLLFRHIVLEIANIADVADISRAIYKDHPELGEMHAALAKAFEFFKYIRNKFVGHMVENLTSKTFEWLPHAYSTLGKTDAAHQGILSWFVLETVINTYTDPTTSHKIFESETDLNYPPDRTRFMNYLGQAAEGSLRYAASLIEVTVGYVDIPDLKNDWLQLAIKAGETDFAYLTKKR